MMHMVTLGRSSLFFIYSSLDWAEEGDGEANV
jgi:hypothetical protein